jgi:hypothetical protein
MALKSGSIAQSKNDVATWNTSMAKAIEQAFLDEWSAALPDQDPPVMNDTARLMFVAIAKGVIKHLGENGSAFNVATQTANSHTHATTTTISTSIPQ